jgi:hypothetical protein
MKPVDLLIPIDLTESNVNRESRVIRNTVVLSGVSRNKNGSVRRRYTEAALNSAVRNLEGAAAYANHKRKNLHEGRDALGAFGVHKNLRHYNGKVYSDIHCFAGIDGDKALSIAEVAPHLIGNSIHAGGKFRRENGIEVIEEILPHTSQGNPATIDAVTNPATTTTLFEDNDDSTDKNKKQKKGNKMEPIDLMEATFDDVKSKRPDLYQKFDMSDKVKELKESVEKLEDEIKTLKAENDELKTKENYLSKTSLMESLISKADIKPDLVTDVFKEQLMNVQESKDGDKVITVEEKMKALINDRAALTKGVKNMGTGKTVDVFESKDEDKGRIDYSKLSTRQKKAIFMKKRGI